MSFWGAFWRRSGRPFLNRFDILETPLESGGKISNNFFYSDSLADTPLALCAEKAHLVKDHATTVVDWPELDDQTMKIVKDKIGTGWSIHLKED